MALVSSEGFLGVFTVAKGTGISRSDPTRPRRTPSGLTGHGQVCLGSL
jgi:hypothetical protein